VQGGNTQRTAPGSASSPRSQAQHQSNKGKVSCLLESWGGGVRNKKFNRRRGRRQIENPTQIHNSRFRKPRHETRKILRFLRAGVPTWCIRVEMYTHSGIMEELLVHHNGGDAAERDRKKKKTYRIVTTLKNKDKRMKKSDSQEMWIPRLPRFQVSEEELEKRPINQKSRPSRQHQSALSCAQEKNTIRSRCSPRKEVVLTPLTMGQEQRDSGKGGEEASGDGNKEQERTGREGTGQTVF